jgi:hypothetical protein
MAGYAAVTGAELEHLRVEVAHRGLIESCKYSAFWA